MTEEELKATAGAFNAETPDAAANEGENAARAAAAEYNQAGNENHEGAREVRPDTEEEAAAAEAKKAAAAAEEAAAAEQAAEDAKTPEQKAEEAAAAEALRKQVAEEVNAAGWMTSEDPTLQAALNLMKASGMSPAEANEHFGEVLDTGDASRVDIPALEARVGKDNADLIMAGVTKVANEQSDEVLQKVNAIQQEVGGPDNWAKMVQWSKNAARADETVRAQLSDLQDMMNGSTIQGKLAAQEMLRMYNADAKNSTLTNTPRTTPTLTPTTSAPATPAAEPLSKREYVEAIQQLKSRGAARAADMARLSAGRAAARKLGY